MTRFFTSKLVFIVYIAWRNVWRYPVRSILTVFALAGGLTIVIFYAALIGGMTKEMSTQATEVSTGYIQIHEQTFKQDGDLYGLIPDSTIDGLTRSVSALSFSPRLYAFALASSGRFSTGVQIRGIAAYEEKSVSALGAKNLLSSVDNPLLNSTAMRPVVVGNKLAKQLELSIGSELILVTQSADGSIGNDLYTVEGIAKSVDAGFDRMGVLMRISEFRELMVIPEGIHEIAVNINDVPLDDAYHAVVETLIQQYSDAKTEPPVVRTWRELNPAISDMIELQRAVVGYIGLAVMFMASFGVMNTIFMSIFERKYEFGVMRAVGMKTQHLFAMVLCETFFLTILAGMIGNSAGYVLSKYYEVQGIDFSSLMPDGYDWAGMSIEPVLKTDFQWYAVQQSNLIMFIVVVFATLYPLQRTLRKKAVELLS